MKKFEYNARLTLCCRKFVNIYQHAVNQISVKLLVHINMTNVAKRLTKNTFPKNYNLLFYL